MLCRSDIMSYEEAFIDCSWPFPEIIYLDTFELTTFPVVRAGKWPKLRLCKFTIHILQSTPKKHFHNKAIMISTTITYTCRSQTCQYAILCEFCYYGYPRASANLPYLIFNRKLDAINSVTNKTFYWSLQKPMIALESFFFIANIYLCTFCLFLWV